MAEINPNIIMFLEDLPFFKGLDHQIISDILKNSTIHAYDKGQGILHNGDTATRLFVILNGWIKLYRTTEEGDEAIIGLLTRGDIFGETTVFTDGIHKYSVEAAEKSKIIEIPLALMRNYAESNNEIMCRIMKLMSREMHKLQMENEHMVLMSASQRVGCLLLQLSSGMKGEGGVFSFPFEKSLAAARLGMKPETFSRALSQLKDFGVSVKGNEVSINSFKCLAGFACGHCSADLQGCQGAKRKECLGKGCN